MHVVFNVIIFLLFGRIYCDTTLEYYKNLILERTAAAQTYDSPQNNAEFRTDTESSDLIDIGSYDFIIIGAGTAGSVLATRLSEIDEWNILLLEAGGEEDDFSKIPSMYTFLQFSKMNWGYYTTPQTNGCLGMKDKRCTAPRGKSIGGSSAINAVLYSRGHPKDFDKWVELGNHGWSFEEVLPYFIKSENSQIKGDPGYHGKGGFWNVESLFPRSDIFDNIVRSNEELNNMLTADYNGQQEIGVSATQSNIKRGKRQSTGTAFLENARKRTNLRIITQALVTKIKIDENTKTAEGVIFVTNNTKFSATATKEVLVSGGAFNSPQLLMLSGVGPKKHLEEMGINVIEDLPVGKNLLEHPTFPGLVFRTNYTYRQDDINTLIENYLNGFGPLTNAFNVDPLGFIQTERNSKDVPSIEYLFIPPGGSMMSILTRVLNYDDEMIDKFFKKINPQTDIMIFIILLHPKSKGRLTLKSSDPIDFPNIDINLFSEPEDVNTILEGVEFALKLTETKALRELNATLVDFQICEGFEKYSKDYWDCAIRHLGSTLYHPCGTTAMGPDKTTSVVDTNLKVHGIEKLRVVDAGVLPSTISGHTSAPTVMVAEKISDVIKKEYGLKSDMSSFFGGHSSSSLNHCYGSKEKCYGD